MPRVLEGSWRNGRFLMSEVPLQARWSSRQRAVVPCKPTEFVTSSAELWDNFEEPLERLTPPAASIPVAERIFGRKCVCAA